MVNARSRGRRAVRLAVGLAVLLVLGLGVLNAGTALVIEVPLEHPEAIIALGSHEWERLPAAAQQAHQNPNALVFLTQPRVATVHNCHDCAHRADRLVAAGIPARRIVMLPYRVSNTRDEAIAARDECVRRGIQRLLVVTSPYHTRRVQGVFGRIFAGTGATVGVMAARAYSPAQPERWWMRAYDRAYVRYEWGAILYRSIWP
jgi:uncharacterized SAM-binding protein YcdF (DUF218 family)